MSSGLISVRNLTKDYGDNRGVFDISLDIQEGEVFGYLGTNGSGKTTTIRHMMGFLKPDSGEVLVNGLNPWKQAPEVMRDVSYIPGEIAFPDLTTGTDFLKVQAQFLGVKDFTYMNHLIDLLGLDPSANLKRMSKGMKQKTAIVAALMGDKKILLMDEPTTGLDPLMRETFLELVREEKKKGRTIFMSSHIFEEIEDVCDRVAIIGNGKIKDVLSLYKLRQDTPRMFRITFANEAAAQEYVNRVPEAAIDGRGTYPGESAAPDQDRQYENASRLPGSSKVSFAVPAAETDRVIKATKGLPIVSVDETHEDLEEYFMNIYRKEIRQ
ncbi:MAG: ATP-binding cassette domain-containing protein [Lachnospiraceae bacterium]|nr:ATP-binding cassette domain-containing protein [Lachnospiraceae bacterium]